MLSLCRTNPTLRHHPQTQGNQPYWQVVLLSASINTKDSKEMKPRRVIHGEAVQGLGRFSFAVPLTVSLSLARLKKGRLCLLKLIFGPAKLAKKH